jgi:hypothetical protein
VSVGDELFGIDHGLCFHEDFKLRTVIWEFAGEPVPDDLLEDLDRLRVCGLPDPLCELLEAHEQEAVLDRVGLLLRLEHFPLDETGHRYPWPLV